MDFRQKLHRILIALNAVCSGLTRHKQKRKTNSPKKNNVLIVFQQLFGDAVILQNSLEEYTKIFQKSEGHNITLLCRPSVARFMQATLELPDDIKVETVDFRKFLEDFWYYRQIVKKYEGIVDILIVPGTSLSAEIFAASSDASRKIGLIRCFDVKKPFAMAVFSRIAYTETVRPAKEDMMLQRHGLLLDYLGASGFKAGLPVLKRKERIIHENHYCVICPGASKKEKCWPIENFARVIDFMTETYDMNIHLCGGSDEKEYETKILALVRCPERVKSHIGKTSYSDWSAIVQHADLIVGNDSGTMHLAAAGRRKAVCIAGVYDKNQFFPYKTDKPEERELLPITISRDMPCQWCRTIGYDAGYGNNACKKRIHENKCALCIDHISADEVIWTIEEIMQGDQYS